MAAEHDTRTTGLPFEVLDGIVDLNHRLEAFQLMHYAWLRHYLKDASDTRYEAISGGVHDMLGDMLTGYQDLAAQLTLLQDASRQEDLRV